MSVVLHPSTQVYNLTTTPLEDLILSNLESTSDLRPTLMDACRRYGDYLHGKGDFDSAVKQYVRTIGSVPPSYIIRKFLDAQRIANLTTYLQALHEKGAANPNHTTLLLNCYTKLNDLESLNAFIDTSEGFEIDTAIVVCRNGGYFPQALGIASKFEQHDWYIRIQIEDLKLYDEAISYLSNLSPSLFRDTLSKYGYLLVTNRPLKMTRLLLDGMKKEEFLEIKEIISFYLAKPGYCVLFLEGLLNQKYGIVLSGDTEQDTDAECEDEEAFMICDTLLDISLALLQTGQPLPNQTFSKERWEERILAILHRAPYDLENALFLVKQYQFDKGALVLYEKLNLFEEYLDQAEDFKSVLETCMKYGERRPELWVKGIEYCAKECKDDKENDNLIEILNEITTRNVISDVQIIQLLSKCGVSLGSVRPYLVEKMKKGKKMLETSNTHILGYEEEIAKIVAEIDDIEQRPISFLSTKCELCKQNLTLPTLHFYCRHSYHSNCLGDMTHECPRYPFCLANLRCGPERHMIEETIKTQIANSKRHKEFEDKV